MTGRGAGMTGRGAGMTEWGREREREGGGEGLGAESGEIPAASAGMTDLSRGYDGSFLRGCDGVGARV